MAKRTAKTTRAHGASRTARATEGLVPALVLVRAPRRIPGQCPAECAVPQHDGAGNVSCRANPGCTALGCKCNLFAAPVGTANWEKVANQGVKIPAAPGTMYRCWCAT